MLTTQARKNKVTLSDYDYQRDIQNRLFLTKLTPFEIDIITEIVDNSVNTSIERIARDLDIKEEKILPTVQKCQEIGLVDMSGKNIRVNKEMRKYFETHLEKFNDDFNPTLEYLHELLNKVPIHVLPNWYSIPRATDTIFGSIVEKYMIDPRTYNAYLDELTFDNPDLNWIYNEVYASPKFTVTTSSIMKRFSLSREKMIEFSLLLEYNFACCLCYRKGKNGKFEEILTPFHEWKEYLNFQINSKPTAIKATKDLKQHHPEDFGFVKDLTRIIEALKKGPLSLVKTEDGWTLNEEILPHYNEIASPDIHIKNLLCMAGQLQLAFVHEESLLIGSQAEEWLKSPTIDQALIVYRQPSRTFRLLDKKGIAHTDRDIRETEKNMKRIAKSGWIYFDDFLTGFTAPLGNQDPVMLKRKGRRWCYACPEYSEEDLLLLEAIVFGHLFETGIIKIGMIQKKRCLCVTSFGKQVLLGE